MRRGRRDHGARSRRSRPTRLRSSLTSPQPTTSAAWRYSFTVTASAASLGRSSWHERASRQLPGHGGYSTRRSTCVSAWVGAFASESGALTKASTSLAELLDGVDARDDLDEDQVRQRQYLADEIE